MEKNKGLKQKWYATHVVEYFKFIKGKQDRYPIWETIILVKASSEKEAKKRGAWFGKDKFPEGFKCSGRPIKSMLAGVRTVRVVDIDNIFKGKIVDGLEVSVKKYIIDSWKKLDEFYYSDSVYITLLS